MDGGKMGDCIVLNWENVFKLKRFPQNWAIVGATLAVAQIWVNVSQNRAIEITISLEWFQ